ncbi:MAG: hypothetical protein BRC58_09240 [Cyanobacteria bacterium QS_8_64_29]|nr:MAG: hypothetical protein BRC58_09240 [Cyanobacteria bacterium QS_8_64_29]
MYRQFRTAYPQGGLTSELIAIDRGRYLVRASVRDGDTTLATGLAGAETIEQAEDEARRRALAALALESKAEAADRAPDAVSAASPSTPEPAPPAATDPPSPPDPPSLEAPVPNASLEAEAGSNGHASVATPEAPAPSAPQEAPPLEAEAPASEAAAPAADGAESESIDFSDLIARTDVELKRLGWTRERGRDYLLNTYGKRSRQLLSESELTAFLRYLEAQPSPEEGAN